MAGEGADCAWVHAYLHRMEGDPGNARYWYRQARKRPATGPIEAEWAAIAAELLADLLQPAVNLKEILLFSSPPVA